MHQNPALLITQCLQNDFVKPIGKFDSLPSQLHIGYAEAQRLMGETVNDGPIALMMRWAFQQPQEELNIIHIRDWHDIDDPAQKNHLQQFGLHCLKNTTGAEFAFTQKAEDHTLAIIDSLSLNDFIGTSLATHLAPFANTPIRVGLIGVWTEAKISFLAYDLRSRYPNMEIGICSALTASSSRAHHFLALSQLKRILGVTIFSSIGEFTNFLNGEPIEIPLPTHANHLQLTYDQTKLSLTATDEYLLRYLFRNCQKLSLKILDGGFSGNIVLGTESVDLHGHHQVSHVVKIGPQEAMGTERTAFEQIEDILGNNAPTITEFADHNGRGALKYRYAAMGGGFSNTLQKRYMAGLTQEKTDYFLQIVFEEQLGRFYQAATLESTNLLDYYWFKPEWGAGVKKQITTLVDSDPEQELLYLPSGKSFPNPYLFYERDLAKIIPRAYGAAYFSFVHGDLNGANIIVDAQDNVWLIDFFHTHRGHILKDLIKFENDLLYIFTPLENEADLIAATELTDLLLAVEDLRIPLPPLAETSITHPEMQRAYQTVRFLRSFYPDLIQLDRSPLQLFIGLMRYSIHTLWFDESNHYQKQWALYSSGKLSQLISGTLLNNVPLRVDWLDEQWTQKGKLGLTILPGRLDYQRDLKTDLNDLKEAKVTHIIPLITDDELTQYGVDSLLEQYRNAGFVVNRLPIVDQAVSSEAEMKELINWIDQHLQSGANIMVHCVGGLGRSGLVAACYLKEEGLSTTQAINEVRRARSARAIESAVQEQFVASYQKNNPLQI